MRPFIHLDKVLGFLQNGWAMKSAWVLFFLLLCFSACRSTEKAPVSAQFYFDKALKYKKQESYVEALEQLSLLKKHFFYSSYNQKALLLSADIHFEKGDHKVAIRFYERHSKLYPDIQKDYVLYQMGLSFKRRLPTREDKDLSLAVPALKAFDRLLALKTPSPYKQKAREQKQEILNKLASRELKAVLFYKKIGRLRAGFIRVQQIIKDYPQSLLMPKVLFTAVELAGLLKEDPEPFKKSLVKDYPDSEQAKQLNKSLVL